MADKQQRMARASLMAALGITTFVPAAGATIMISKDREPVIVESEPGSAAAFAQGEAPSVDISPQALEAFFDAGYDYDHAVELADYWGLPSADDAKITKGKFILGLIDFPAAAGYNLIDDALDAYFDAGYDYDHAVELAEYWGLATTYEAKVTKGKVLLGEIDFPEPVDVADTDESFEEFIDRALNAYFDSGYDYDHAVELAEFWGLEDPYDAKIYKGKSLIGAIDFPVQGEFGPVEVEETTTTTTAVLPVIESTTTTAPPVEDESTASPMTPTTADPASEALDAYFDSGYDYDHAVTLAEFWGVDTPYEAKIIKGEFILGRTGFPDEGAFGPVTPTTVSVIDEALDAYFDAGYDYDHAVELAEVWGSASTPYEAKILKGKYLLGLIGFPG